MNEAIEGMQFYTIKCQHCGEEALVEPAEHGPGYSKPLLRYRSFPYGFLYPRELVKYRRGFQSNEITENYQSMGEEEVYYRLAKRNRTDFRGLYVPYHFGDLAMAPAIFVPLVLKEGIEEILKYENEKRTRVFPRYMPYDEAIENIDRFCYAHFMKDLAIEEARRKFSDLHVRYTDGSSAANRAANRNHEFFQVLTGPTGQTRKRYELRRSESEDLEDGAASVDPMEHEVSVNYNKGLGKDFLEKNWLAFVQEYLSTSDKVGFTAQTAVILRKKYLALLNKEMEIEILATKQYAFYKEPPTWTIIFDGTPIRTLKGDGFEYIHHLVSHPRDQFTVFDLAMLTKDLVVTREHPKKMNKDDDFDDNTGKLEAVRKSKEHDRNHEEKRLNSLEIELAMVDQQIDSTEDITSDEVDLDKLKSDREQIQAEIRRVKARLYYRKAEDSATHKQIKNRIAKRIERAVKDIRAACSRAGAHFEQALRPINSYDQCYNPSEDIRWHLK